MAGFGFASVGHFFASVFHDIHVGLQFVEKKALPAIEAAAPIIEGITGLIDPPAVILERAAFQALGVVTAAVSSADAAAVQNGLNISLDAQAVADFKALIATFEKELTTAGVLKAAPVAVAVHAAG